MNSGDETVRALLALNAILVHARTMAFEKRSHDVLANVLDTAELLPLLIIRGGDAMTQFQSALEYLTKMDEGFKLALLHYKGQQ